MSIHTAKPVPLLTILAATALSFVSACDSGNDATSGGALTGTSSASNATAANANAATLSLKVMDPLSGAMVFNDASGAQSMNLVAGHAYLLVANAANLPAGTTLKFTAVNTSVVNAPVQTIVASGGASFTPSSAGDYSLKLIASGSAAGVPATKTYAMVVACQNPTFTENSLNAAGLSVTAGASTNLYNFSAANIVAAANGQAPYQCAYDVTGTGIVDTGFAPCATPVSSYVNYVGSRNIGVIVKDACNTSYSVSRTINLAATTPSMPGNVFISAQTSSAAGSAIGDPRIDAVTYLATNAGNNNIVQPYYYGNGFNIQAFQNYGQSSSVAFGIQIIVGGIGGTFNLTSNVNGTVDTSNATVSKVTYVTDQAGDEAPSASLTSTHCTTTGIHARVENPQGVPCASGYTGGSQNQATVEIYGDYTCSDVSDPTGSISISGTFDGYTHLADYCQGGSGGSGGGVTPIQL